MANEMDYTPELTLTPDLNTGAAGQAASRAPEAPNLTLTPDQQAAEQQRQRQLRF